jgi:hypothetical protein
MDPTGLLNRLVLSASFFISFSFLSCGMIANNEISNAYNNKSINSIDGVVQELKSKKVIFMNEDHTGLNEEIFLAANIPALYNAGLRYLFFEGGPLLSDGNDEYTWFPIFYPWREAGRRYESRTLYDTISGFNTGLSDDDKIKIVYPESSIVNFATDKQTDLNFRDAMAAENIINIMDAEEDDIKGIICYGEAHGSIQIKRSNGTVRVPLGYILKEYYGEYFSGYLLISGTDFTRTRVTKWDDIVSDSRFISSNDINKNIVSYVNRTSTVFVDGYIFEKNMVYGSFYQYHPDPSIIKYLYNRVLIEKPVNGAGDNLNYESQFIKALYYLKLYFGDLFEYDY